MTHALGQGSPGQPDNRSWGQLAPWAGRPTTLVIRPGPWAPLPHPAMWQWLPKAVPGGIATEDVAAGC